ncbi:MAG: hypothetical protein HPY66_3404 [Firmicutes bacterium]|nr:hypothetical protein [Bacillota bacterium]
MLVFREERYLKKCMVKPIYIHYKTRVKGFGMLCSESD